MNYTRLATILRKSFSVYFICIFTVMLSTNLLAQGKGIDEVRNFIEKQVETKINCIIDRDMQQIIAADIFETDLVVNLGNEYNDVNIYSRIILKGDNKDIQFETGYTMLESPDFIQFFHKDFRLKTEKDGINLRSLFFKFDNESRDNFFQIEDKWYFIRSEFFEKNSGYVVEVDNKGKIQSIESFYNLEIEKPAETMGDAYNILFKQSEDKNIDPAIKIAIENNLRDKANYDFELSPLDCDLDLQFYSGKLLYSEIYSNGTESTIEYPFVVIEKNGEIILEESESNLFSNNLFIEAMLEKFKIRDNSEAQIFQDFIDRYLDVEEEHKKFYKEDDIWVFVREESFGDLNGLLVYVNDEGTIKSMDKSDISKENFLRIKMKDKDFEADYAFALIKPTTTSIKVKKTEEVEIEISFNEDMVNAKGAWILTRVNGEDMGFCAGTSMTSPFTDSIPCSYLGKGTHFIEYLLLPPGRNTDNPLEIFSLKVIVK